MQKILKLIKYCLVFIAVSTSLVSAEDQSIKTFSEKFADFDAIVNEALAKFNVPGTAIGIVANNKIVLSKGFGYRNLARQIPVTQNTLFPVASSTKAFTAFILGQLVDEGKLSWDDPVSHYIPEFLLANQELTNRVTIRDLLAHRTGLPRHDAIWIMKEIQKTDIFSILPYFEPSCGLREKYLYNNFMYAVAGSIIERVTGQTWEEAISERVLEPLGMNHTLLSVESLQLSEDYSIPYAEIEGDIQTLSFRSLSALLSAGGINSNVADMLKWVQLHLSSGSFNGLELINKQILQEMHTSQIDFPKISDDEKTVFIKGYGLGWMIGSFRGHTLITHGGHIDGFITEVAFLPEEHLGVVILTNSSSTGKFLVSALRNIIFDKFLNANDVDWLKIEAENYDKEKESLRMPEAIAGVEKSIQELQEFTSTYFNPAFGTVRVFVENGTLNAMYGSSKFPLIPKDEDLFQTKFNELLIYGVNPYGDLTFHRNASGDICEINVPFEVFRWAKPIPFKKLD